MRVLSPAARGSVFRREEAGGPQGGQDMVRRVRVIYNAVGEGFVQIFPFLVQGGKVRAVEEGLGGDVKGGGIAAEPDQEAVLMQEGIVLRASHRAAAGGDDGGSPKRRMNSSGESPSACSNSRSLS